VPRSSWGVVVMAVAAIAWVALIADGVARGADVENMLTIWTAFLFYAVIGGIVVRRRRRNVIGWVLAAMGLVGIVGNLAEAVKARELSVGLLSDTATWISGWYFFAFLGLFLPLIHVFPTGRPLEGWWRVPYASAVSGSALLVLSYLVGPPDEGVNPFEVEAVRSLILALEPLVLVALATGLGAGIVALGVRFHRAAGAERDQIKWVFFGIAVATALMFAGGLLDDVLARHAPALSDGLEFMTFVLPGLAITLAVLRYRLFDIDRIVSRTVSYAVVAIIIAALYSVPVVVLPEALGLSSDLTVAGATLVAAAAFNPLRRRVQRVVDRRFNRQRYDTDGEGEALAARLRTEMDPQQVASELGVVVGRTLQPTTVSIWLASGGS